MLLLYFVGVTVDRGRDVTPAYIFLSSDERYQHNFYFGIRGRDAVGVTLRKTESQVVDVTLDSEQCCIDIFVFTNNIDYRSVVDVTRSVHQSLPSSF